MESTDNNESLTKIGKRPISATKYPKRMPTHVVVFDEQEVHNETLNLLTTKVSANGTNVASPTNSNNSTKTFTITPTENISRVFNIPNISEVKIDILDENQCGDMEKRSPQTSSYILVDNGLADEQPEIIFNATKHGKRRRETSKFPRKKPKKNKVDVKFKIIHFKYRNSKKNIRKRLKKCYRKAKANSRTEQSKKQIYLNALSQVVSTSRVLKKVLAKENLLDECDEDCDCDGSFNSSPSITKKSFISYSSENTLVRISSSSSKTDDFNSIKTVNSVIQVSSNIIPYKTECTPYKTNIIDFAVGISFSASKPVNNQVITSSCEALIHNEDLTSDETFLHPDNTLNTLTSKPPSDVQKNDIDIDVHKLPPMNLNEINVSHGTLIGDRKSVLPACSDDTFVIARTSSDFNKSSIHSDYTFSSNSDTTLRNESLLPNMLTKDELDRRNAILDKVIDLGLYPVITPSTSSGANIGVNEVLVTENVVKSYVIPKNKGDEVEPDLQTNMLMLKKSYEVEKITCLQKNLSLPNDITIKAKIKESEKSQKRSCADEIRNKYPADINDMWERLTLVLDLAVKRLEETLAEKIVNDIRRLSIFNQSESKVLKIDKQTDSYTVAQVTCDRPIPDMVHKEVYVAQEIFKVDTDGNVQCDLVQNQVIDQLMFKLSIETPKPTPISDVSLKKIKRPEIVKDYFEILKPPVSASVGLEVGKGDIVTVSTATEEIPAAEGMHRLKTMLTAPVTFVRENMFIITSVPTFFIVLLCFYGIIAITMKAW